MNALASSRTPSISSSFVLFMSTCVFHFFKKKTLSATTKIYDVLILNLKTAKHSQHISLSADHLNSGANYSQSPFLS